MGDAVGTTDVISTDHATEMADAIWGCATDLTAVTLAEANASMAAEALATTTAATVALAMAHASAEITATVASVVATVPIAYRALLRATHSVIAPAHLELARAAHALP